MSDAISNGLDTIVNRIVEITTETWKISARALLLARLGQELSKEYPDLRARLAGRKLYDVVGKIDKVKILESPKDPLIHALVPAGVDIGEDVAAVFSKPERVPVESCAGMQNDSTSRAEQNAGQGESVLTALLDALSGSDLARISMPLDIVDKLRKKRLK